jgi:hypothetical protein
MGVITEVKKIPEIQIEKDLEKTLSDKYQFFIGQKVNKSIFRVKGKQMVEFAEAIGALSPKYVDVPEIDGKKDYSKIQGTITYPNCFTIDLIWDAMGWKIPPEGEETEEKLLITVPSKILHTGHSYDYINAEIPIKHKQKLYTTGFCKEIYVKNKQLWITLHLDTHTKEGQLVVQSEVNFIVREGGFN